MSGFTGNHDIKVFDGLTVMVMLEQCEPSLTMVEFWESSYGVLGSNIFDEVIYDDIKHKKLCLACLYLSRSSYHADARTRVLEDVKAGTLQIVSVYPKSEMAICPRCQPWAKALSTTSR